MAQIFPKWTNYIPLIGGAVAPLALGTVVAAFWYWGSPWFTDVGYAPTQPIPYSHKLHVGDLGLDCRYCHNTVEHASRAAIPPTATCMNCHANVLKESPRLAPLREAMATDQPVPWIRIHQLPDYAYFDHSVHVAAGVGCATCHGRVDQMAVVSLHAPLSMSWCLDCHRDPVPSLRPPSQVTNMAWDKDTANYDPARDPERKRPVTELHPPLHCSGCHR